MDLDKIEGWHGHLKSLDFFSPFSDDELDVLLEICEPRKYKTYDYIITEGKVCDAIYIVLKGKVIVVKKPTVGKGTKTIGRVDVGSCFGEIGVLLKKPRTATVRAMAEVYLFRITIEQVDGLKVETREKFFRQLASDLALRLEKAGSRITD